MERRVVTNQWLEKIIKPLRAVFYELNPNSLAKLHMDGARPMASHLKGPLDFSHPVVKLHTAIGYWATDANPLLKVVSPAFCALAQDMLQHMKRAEHLPPSIRAELCDGIASGLVLSVQSLPRLPDNQVDLARAVAIKNVFEHAGQMLRGSSHEGLLSTVHFSLLNQISRALDIPLPPEGGFQEVKSVDLPPALDSYVKMAAFFLAKSTTARYAQPKLMISG